MFIILIITVIVVITMSAAIIMVIIVAVAVMTAIVVMFIPMVFIFRIAAVADYRLVTTTSVLRVPCAINVVTQVWRRFVDHHFITAIQVEVSITRW